MTTRDCGACRREGQEPTWPLPRMTSPQAMYVGTMPRVVYDPCRSALLDPPILEGHRLGAAFVADLAWHLGIDDLMDDYELRREEVLVCCWWAGRWGTRKWRGVYGAWAMSAHEHLWHGCVNVADPPRKGQA